MAPGGDVAAPIRTRGEGHPPPRQPCPRSPPPKPHSPPPPQDTEIQRKMERELRLREGACKLLAACSRREQALEAAKSLLVCNSRVLAYMAELQRRKEAQVLRRTARR